MPETPADALDAPDVSHRAAPSAPADFWLALQEHVAQRRPSIAAFLQAGRILAQTDKELVIGFAKQDSFSRETLRDPENLLVVREAVHAVLGRSLQVKIEALDRAPDAENGTPSAVGGLSASVPATEGLQRQKRETIQAVLDIFEGKLIM
jgi:hypothetical protein